MRRVCELNLAGDVLLGVLTENGDQPALALNEGVDHQARAQLPFDADAGVGLRAATWEKRVAGFELAKVQDQIVRRGKMIGTPALIRSGIAPRRIAKEEPVVGIRIVVLVVEIKELRAKIE